jgi:predicted site-specific integrase-resolvase
MKKTFSTATAARRIGVSFRTLNRWLADEKIRPSLAVPLAGGRTLWRWTEADIAKGKRVKVTQKSGPTAGGK